MSKPWNRTPRGRFAGSKSLTDDQVLLIRKLASCTGLSHGQLSQQFGVSRSLVTRIVNGSSRAAGPKRPLSPLGGTQTA